MTDLILHTQELPELSVSQISTLPADRLQQLDITLNELTTWVKQAREKLNVALDQRYGDQARAALLASGRDFGTTHVSDGALRITFELPKRVSWDQPQLAAMVARIQAAGDHPEEYVDTEYSISESRYNHWPQGLREQFANARTVKPGKPSFRLAWIEE